MYEIMGTCIEDNMGMCDTYAIGNRFICPDPTLYFYVELSAGYK